MELIYGKLTRLLLHVNHWTDTISTHITHGQVWLTHNLRRSRTYRPSYIICQNLAKHGTVHPYEFRCMFLKMRTLKLEWKKILQALGLIKRPQFSTFRERLPALQQCLTIGFLAMCDRWHRLFWNNSWQPTRFLTTNKHPSLQCVTASLWTLTHIGSIAMCLCNRIRFLYPVFIITTQKCDATPLFEFL